jgi:hypothetical protein
VIFERKVISDQISAIRKQERNNAETLRIQRYAERAGKGRSLHCAARRARKRRGEKIGPLRSG